MSTFSTDLKYGFRQLRKHPGFTAIALLTLAIGIGANTVMFSVVNVLLVRPIQVREPDRLVACKVRGFRGSFPYEAYEKLREHNPVFMDLVAHDEGFGEATLAQGHNRRRVMHMYVSANYFPTLGVTPHLGRLFLAQEELYHAQPVAILSFPAWKRLGGTPDLVGQPILLNNVSVQIVGVTPEGFTGTTVLGPDIWLPLGCSGRIHHLTQSKLPPEKWVRLQYPSLLLTGRLKPGLTRSEAQAQLQPLIAMLQEDHPRQCPAGCSYQIRDLPRFSNMGGDQDRLGMKILSTLFMAISGIVLLIACLNLANMLVVQGAGRKREIAVRMAIGGQRFAIMRQLFVESMLLALLGGVAGLLFAFGGMRVLNAWLASAQMPVEFAAAVKLGFDWRVLGVTLGVCMLAAALFGLKPAFVLTRRDILKDIKELTGGGSNASARGRIRMPRGLSVVSQIALSVVLVLGAALLTQAALQALNPNPGRDQRGKLIMVVDPSVTRHDNAPTRQLCDSVVDHVRSLPGIQSVSLSGGARGGEVREYRGENDSELRTRSIVSYSNARAIGSDYLEAVDLPLLQGRIFTELDCASDAEDVVIIDDLLAKKLRPDGNALGCMIQAGHSAFGFSDPRRVVGIVPYLQEVSDSKEAVPCMYTPLSLDQVPGYFHLRANTPTRKAEASLLEKLPAEIRRAAPTLSMLSISTLRDHQRSNPFVWFAAIAAKLAVSFGVMALFLASLGIYAVKGYMVASRTPEIGIRKALGATGQDITGMVFKEGLALTVLGLTLGLFLGWCAVHLLRSFLFGIDSMNIASIIVTVTILATATFIAGYFPARRAARIDPMEALRYE